MCLFRPGQTIVPSSKSLKTLGIQHLLAWIACKPCILKRPGNNDLLQWHENACCRTYTLSDKNLKISKKLKINMFKGLQYFFSFGQSTGPFVTWHQWEGGKSAVVVTHGSIKEFHILTAKNPAWKKYHGFL